MGEGRLNVSRRGKRKKNVTKGIITKTISMAISAGSKKRLIIVCLIQVEIDISNGRPKSPAVSNFKNKKRV